MNGWLEIRYNKAMTEERPNGTAPLERLLRNLLGVVTTLAMLAALTWFGSTFYTLVSMLGMVMIVTYILLGPVNLLEKGILYLSDTGMKRPRYRRIMNGPEANPRIVAVIVVFTVFLLTLAYSAVRFLPELTRQVAAMGGSATEHITRISDRSIGWVDAQVGEGAIKRLFKEDIDEARNQGIIKLSSGKGRPATADEREVIRTSVFQSTVDQADRFLGGAIPSMVVLVTGTLNGFVYFLAGLLLIFYFLVDGHKFKPSVMNLLPDRNARRTTAELLDSFHMVMFAFIKGQFMLGLLTGAYMFIVYKLFGVPYAFLLGVIFAIAELLPVVGTWIGIGIGLTVILLNMPPQYAFYVWCCSYGFQTIKDNILAPKVVGDVMGLHPLAIIMSLMICAQLMGLLGILLALPLASMLNVIVRMLLRRDEEEKETGEGVA